MSTPIVELTHRAFEAMNRHDLDWLVAHCDPGVERHMQGVAGEPVLYVGAAGIRDYLRDIAEIWDSGANEELFEAGDAYYVGPGHTAILYAGTEVVEFSPTEELGETMEVVTKNMEQMEASA